jgi:molybdate transport system substrate-binding protein
LRRAAVVAITTVLVLAGCGGGASGDKTLTVFAASSLRVPLTEYAKDFPDAKVRFSFAASDKLAAQIRQGAKPDVFASADAAITDKLWHDNLLDGPVPIAQNRLVIAVPKGSKEVTSVDDLTKSGVTLAVGADETPIGRYTRRFLGLIPNKALAILRNVKTEEPDVAGITGKVRQGSVDAGIVYYSEVVESRGALEAVEIDSGIAAEISAAILVKSTKRKAAQAFLDGLVTGKGQEALRRGGFQPPVP